MFLGVNRQWLHLPSSTTGEGDLTSPCQTEGRHRRVAEDRTSTIRDGTPSLDVGLRGEVRHQGCPGPSPIVHGQWLAQAWWKLWWTPAPSGVRYRLGLGRGDRRLVLGTRRLGVIALPRPLLLPEGTDPVPGSATRLPARGPERALHQFGGAAPHHHITQVLLRPPAHFVQHGDPRLEPVGE